MHGNLIPPFSFIGSSFNYENVVDFVPGIKITNWWCSSATMGTYKWCMGYFVGHILVMLPLVMLHRFEIQPKWAYMCMKPAGALQSPLKENFQKGSPGPIWRLPFGVYTKLQRSSLQRGLWAPCKRPFIEASVKPQGLSYKGFLRSHLGGFLTGGLNTNLRLPYI